jgi:hypothetical protein
VIDELDRQLDDLIAAEIGADDVQPVGPGSPPALITRMWSRRLGAVAG